MTAGSEPEHLAVLVHEVRSPVAALRAIAEAYRDGDATARRSLSALAIAACAGIERIVVDASVASVRPTKVDVRRLVDETVVAWALTGGNVRADIAPGVALHIEGDRLRLRQALDNLVGNALAHSPEGEEVVVGATPGDGDVLISVVDRGVGIPPEEHERIFDTGVRLNADPPGSGLGLAIARAIASAHGGRLTVASALGEGATFTLALPRHR
jgi:two-component system, OmpR family, sensor kinase